MIPIMREPNPPGDLNAIENFERERGILLPPSYKRFLLTVNGGVPENPAFPVLGHDRFAVHVLRTFLAVGGRWPTEELARVYDLYSGGIPEGVIPIAGDDFGSYVCIDAREGNDRVVFWDKHHFWGTGEWRERDLYFVAHSFEEFLTSLSPDPYAA